MKVLVTGGTGFIGTHLVRRLCAHGYQVRALVRPTSDATILQTLGVELAQGDVRDFASVRDAMAGRDVVFHLAVSRHPPAKQPSETRVVEHRAGDASVVVGGAENVARAADEVRVRRLVHTSSAGVYGSRPRLPVNEESPVRPDRPYRRVRVEAERVVGDYARRHGVPAVIARLTHVYGPGDRAWLPVFRKIADGGFTVLGSGGQFHHVSYVEDIVAALIACARSDGAVGQTYIVGSEPLSLWRFLTLVAEEMGVSVRRLPWLDPPLRGALAVYDLLGRPMARRLGVLERLEFHLHPRHYDLSKARRDLELPPPVPPREAIRATLDWYRSQGHL